MKRVLCIDDEEGILDCLDRALRSQGYDVLTTPDPDKGLAILTEARDLDLVTLDIRMPGRSGFDVYREYRKVKKLPALFVTAYPKSFNVANDEVMQMWRDEFADGTTDIIYKPFDLSTLFEKVEGLIGKADEPYPEQSD